MTDPYNIQLHRQLLKCADAGDLAGVALLLAQGADPRPHACKSLSFAAGNGHHECVKILIPVSDPKAQDSSALRSAACNGHAECVKLLIPFSDPKAHHSAALSSAAANGHAECVKLLIPVSDPVPNAVYFASENGHAECVKLLIPVSDPKANNCIALRHAARYGHADCVKLLIPKSAPLIEIQGLVAEVIYAGDPAILSIMIAHEPRLLDGADIGAMLVAAVAASRPELAALLRSLLEHKDIDGHISTSLAALQKTSRL